MTKLVKHLGRVSQSRNEFYNFGLGLGLLLDRVKPDWQSSYFDAGLWLDDIYRASAESRPAN